MITGRGRVRGWVATLVASCLIALSVGVSAPAVADSSAFSDVGPSPFYTYIQWMFSSGISTGTPNPPGLPLYKPSASVSRQAMASFLFKLSGQSFAAPGSPTFADVDSSSPFDTAIEWMASQGISTGTPQPSGKPLYKPTDPVSRQAMALFLARYAHADLSAAPDNQSFVDVPVSSSPAAAIGWMASSGISTGTPQASGLPVYLPSAAVSRQAMAAFLYRLAHLPWSVGSIDLNMVAGTSSQTAVDIYLPPATGSLSVSVSGTAASWVSLDTTGLTPTAGGRWEGTVKADPSFDTGGSYSGSIVLLSNGTPLGVPLEVNVTVAVASANSVPAALSAPLASDRTTLAGSPVSGNEVDVEIKSAVADPDASAERIASANNAVIIGSSSDNRIYQLRISGLSESQLSDLATELESDADVDSAFLPLAGTSDTADPVNDSQWSGQWGNPGGKNWGQKLIDAQDAWNVSTGSGVKVGIIDVGFDTGHEDLSTNIASSRGQGNFAPHGTNVAGIACAVGNNGVGIAGVAYNCRLNLQAVQNGETSISQFRESMASVARAGSRVVNVSYGWSTNFDCLSSSQTTDERAQVAEIVEVRKQILQEAEQFPNVLWVFSAGNGTERNPSYGGFDPSVDQRLDTSCDSAGALGQGYPNIVSVASVDESGGLAVYSNTGTGITVAAPGGGLGNGAGILSTAPRSCFLFICSSGDYARMSGTSQAAPMVTGIAALEFGANPSLTAAQARQCILAGATQAAHRIGSEPYFLANAMNSVLCAQTMGASTGGVLDTIPAGSSPTGIAIDSPLHRAYVANSNDNSVSVLNTDTGLITATVGVGQSPVGIAVDSSIHRVFVSNSGANTVSVIDESTNAVMATLGGFDAPGNLAVDPVTHKVYIPNGGQGITCDVNNVCTPPDPSNTVSVVDGISLASDGSIAVGLHPGSVAIDDGIGKAFVTNASTTTVSTVDLATGASTATTDLGLLYPQGVTVNTVTHNVYVSTNQGATIKVLNGLTGAVTATFDPKCWPGAVVEDSSARLLLVPCWAGPAANPSNDGSKGIVEVMDDHTGAVIRTFPAHAAAFVSIEPSSGLAYVTSNNPPYVISVAKYK